MDEISQDPCHWNELKFSREQGFFDRNRVIRSLIGLLFVSAIFAVLHFREVPVDIPELNSLAPNYIVAQVDIDFVDDEATLILRQEAVRDVGKIYRISDAQIDKRRFEFENFLQFNQEWRRESEADEIKQLYEMIGVLEKALLQVRLTDRRTLQKMREVGAPTVGYLVFTPERGEEERDLPDEVWEYLRLATQESVAGHAVTHELAISFFKDRVWSLVDDIPAQKELRKQIQARVPEKMSRLSAGSRIIDQGERVTARHVAILQAMKQIIGDKRNLWHPMTVIGSLMMSLLLTGICYAFVSINYPQIIRSNRKLFLLLTICLLTLILSKGIEIVMLSSRISFIDRVGQPLFVPLAAILTCNLLHAGIATFVAGFLTVLLTFVISFDNLPFMVTNLAASMVAILNTHSLRQRKEIVSVCTKAWVAAIAVIMSIHMYDNSLFQLVFLGDVVSAGFFMLLTIILVIGLLPLFESVFGVMTDVSMIEYLDPNHPLLRRLTIEAPGTYQHSVMVGNLAEAAASKIGANGLFCRVASLYHDIGKIATPQYFTENQQPGMNLHQLLTPEESAQVILAHISEGVALARKAGLPEQFIDVIKEHHGTTLTYYFYRKQLEKMGEDAAQIDESKFRYAGPKPRTKESAIIMLADSLEAASRTLEPVNEETLKEMSDKIIKTKIDSGQFDRSLLTFEELAIVQQTLIDTLAAYWHSRIKYPK